MASDSLSFTKMHGLRNDYVVVDATQAPPADPAALARAVGDRRGGVGSDGLLLALPSAEADIRMRMFNPDGSEAEMCGNGLRCLALFAADRGLVPDASSMRVETGAGILTAHVDAARQGPSAQVTVDMGTPNVLGPLDLGVDGHDHALLRVSMGNPHAVLFVDDVDAVPVGSLGPRIETDDAFPDRTNVEFVQVLATDHVRQRTWERGAGETLACGTGACAVVVAGAERGLTARSVRVDLRGGTLAVTWRADDHVEIRGPAVTVFEGRWPVAPGDA